MKLIDIKVNIIYWWRTHKEDVGDFFVGLTSPLWFPFIIIFLPIMMWDQGEPEEDMRWCKEHHFVYPSHLGWDCHRQVRKWQKEYKKAEKDKGKKAILYELQLESKREQCWNTGVGHASRFDVMSCKGCKHYDRCFDSMCGY